MNMDHVDTEAIDEQFVERWLAERGSRAIYAPPGWQGIAYMFSDDSVMTVGDNITPDAFVTMGAIERAVMVARLRTLADLVERHAFKDAVTTA